MGSGLMRHSTRRNSLLLLLTQPEQQVRFRPLLLKHGAHFGFQFQTSRKIRFRQGLAASANSREALLSSEVISSSKLLPP